MTTRRNFRNGSNNATRAAKSQMKLQRLRDKVRASTQAFMARHQERMGWWQRTFRTPAIGFSWLFQKAMSLAQAFLTILGLQTASFKPRTSFSGRSSIVTRHSLLRALIHEPLEARQLLAAD